MKSNEPYKAGDLLISRTLDGKQGQLRLSFWEDSIAIVIGKEPYVSPDPNDCSDGVVEDWRWIILENGSLMACTETMLEWTYERRRSS